MNRFFLFFNLLLVVLLINTNSAFAATSTWTGAVNNDWNTAGNWSGGVPTSTSDVIINNFNAIMTKSSGLGAVTVHSLTITSSIIELGNNFTGITVNSTAGSVPAYTFKMTSSKITPQNQSFTSLTITGVSPVLITGSTLGTTTGTAKYSVSITNTSTTGGDNSNQSVIIDGYYPPPVNTPPITFDGGFTCTSNTYIFTSCVFNATTNITKGGTVESLKNAGNNFNGIVTLTNNGSADLSWGNGDNFNSTTALVTITNNSSSAYFYIASSSANTTATFYGPVTANNTSSGFLVFSKTVDNVVAFAGTAIKAVNLYNTSSGKIQLSNSGSITFTYANIQLGNTGTGGTYIGFDPLSVKTVTMDAFTTFTVSSTGTSIPLFTNGLLYIDRLGLSGSTGSTSISLGSTATIDLKSNASWGRPTTINAYTIIGIGGTWTNSHTFNLLSGAPLQYTDTYNGLSITGSISFINNSINPWSIGGLSNHTTGAAISTTSNNICTFSSPFNFYRSTCTIQTNSTGDITFGYSPSTINFTNFGINLKRNGATTGSVYFGNLANINITSKDSTLAPTQYEKSIVTIDQVGSTAYNSTQQKWLPQISLGSIGAGAGLCSFFGYMTTTNFKGGCLNFGNFSGLTDVIVTTGGTPDATTLVSFSADAATNPTYKPAFSRNTCVKCQNIVSTGGVFGTQALTTPSLYSWTTTFYRLGGATANVNYFSGENTFSSQLIIRSNSSLGLLFGNAAADKFTYYGHVTLYKSSSGDLRTSAAGTSYYYGDYNYNGTPDATAMAGLSIFTGSSDQTISSSLLLRFNLVQMSKDIPIAPSLPKNVILAAPVNIEGSSGQLNLISGNIKTTSTYLLNIDNGSIIVGGNNISFVDGPLKKTGSIPSGIEFKFHIGKTSTSGSVVTNIYMPVSITMPLQTTSTYTAEFFNTTEPMGDLMAASTGIRDFNRCQYWVISHTGPNENIAVSLPWNNAVGQTCYPVNPNVVCVAEYSIGQWLNVGSNVTVSGSQGVVKSDILTSQLTVPNVYFAIGYRNALVINTIGANPSIYRVLNHTEALSGNFVSGPSGTSAGSQTSVSNTNNVPGKIVIHPDFGVTIDLKIDQAFKDPLLASLDPKADALTYESLDMQLYTNAAGATPVCSLVTAKETGTVYTTLSDQYHNRSGNSLSFYKQRQEDNVYVLSNNLSDGITFPVNVSGTTTPFQITNVPSGVTSATLNVKNLAGTTTLYTTTTNPLSWDGKVSGVYVAEGVYNYVLTFTAASQNYIYNGQLIVKYQ